VHIDPDFAKQQLLVVLREYYMHPNGQIPAYEWNFSDVNPPVHAWSVWQVYETDKKKTGICDWDFLERAFQKLLMNFTWWVNQKDENWYRYF
jgi:starvation-inducible outer membrane lipoprotein